MSPAGGRRARRLFSCRVAGALLVLLLVGACEQSRVDPNAAVRIGGSVVGPGGQPLAGRPVHLGAGISDSEVGLAIFTVGLSCTTGACRGKQVDTKTDAAGAFAFDLKGSDTRSTFGEPLSELVTASAAPGPGQISGASVSARFKVQTEQVTLPVAKLIDPALTLQVGPSLHATWATIAPGPYDVTFEDGTTQPVWHATTSTSDVAIDPRVLEDTSGRVVVAGASQDEIQGSHVDIHWRSPGVGYVGVRTAPPSRGKSCRYIASSGAATPPRCGLTDGDLANTAVAPATCDASTTSSAACEAPTAVDVDLGSAVPSELVVVRGCAAACDVAVSRDGASFTPVGSLSGDAAISLDGTPITAVRVGFDAASLSSLREVSVWGPAPSVIAAAPAGGQVDDLRSKFGQGSKDDSIPVLLVVLAAGVVIVLLLAIGITIGRRSRST